MQTPAPFEYERATSVEGAIASLERLGPEARIIAGGHSLLPMMKLRLASPEHLIDINDLTELAYIREDEGMIKIGALTRHVELLKSDLLARALPALPRRRAGDRRPGGAQPRHDRRLAVPGRRGRGPLGGLLRRRRRTSSSAAPRASATVSMEDFHVGPYMTAVGAGELLTEIRLPLFPGAGSAHEKVERRAGDWAIAAASAAVWIEGGTLGQVGIALSAVGMTTDPPHARRGAAARQAAVGGAVRAGARDRRPRTARRAPTGAGRSTTSATSPACSPTARCAARRNARAAVMNVTITAQRPGRHPRRRAAPAARALHPRGRRAAPARTGAATPPTAAPASC